MTRRDERLTSLIENLAGRYLEEVSDRKSMITITRAILAEDGKSVECLFTVFPTTAEEAALGFAKRHAGECRTYIATHARVRHVPFLTFDLDRGEKNRQRIDELLKS